MAWRCEDAKRKITEILCFSFSEAQEKKNRGSVILYTQLAAKNIIRKRRAISGQTADDKLYLVI